MKEKLGDVARNGIRYFVENGLTSTLIRIVDFLRKEFTLHRSRSRGVSFGGKKLSISPRDWPASTPRKIFDNDELLIIGDFGLPQCLKYRVLQKVEVLTGKNRAVSIANQFDRPRVMSLMQFASAVIFYRLYPSTEVLEYFAEAQRLNVVKIYEVDDPIFDKEALSKSENVALLPEGQRSAILQASDRYLDFMKGFDVLLGSTPGLCKRMEELIGRKAYLWRNMLDSETIGMVPVTKEKANKEQITIAYGSGSTAHGADFSVVRNVLFNALLEIKDLNLLLIGHCDCLEDFERFGDRVRVEPFTSYGNYLRLLGESDIAIVPLTKDCFNECKSAIRYLDASIVGVPTVATSVGDFENVIIQGVTGILCADSEDWKEAIHRLISNPSLRRDIGMAAKRHVLNRYDLSSFVRSGNIDNEILAIVFRDWKS